MFIEHASAKMTRSSGAKRKSFSSTLLGTSRSAGAPNTLGHMVYKHLAPLEPEHHLVAAWAALCNVDKQTLVTQPQADAYLTSAVEIDKCH